MYAAASRIETIRGPETSWPTREEMERAREVQLRLLSRDAPALETLEYGGCYLPAQSVGGDYYDFFHLGLGKIGMALGDISGKGVPAAIMMASLQAILRSHSATFPQDIGRALRSVNRLFCDCTVDSHFASLFLAEYDDSTCILRYANCGHNPPLILHRDFTVDRLESTATVLGIFQDWTCSVREARLKHGDTLLLYTDGITEAENSFGEEFGEQRLLAVIRRCRFLSISGMIREAAADLRAFGGSRLRDDATLLVARCMKSKGETRHAATH